MKSLPLLAAILATAPLPVSSAILRVAAGSVAATPDGSSWATAFPTLQDALAAAGSGDEIWVAAGTYHPDEGASAIPDDRASTFAITADVAIYGGFAGTESLLSERNPAAHPVILSGEIQDDADPTNNTYHVVLITDGDDATFQDVLLDGLTITGGYADLDSGGNNQGAGIDNRENLTLRKVTVADNFATDQCGGVALGLGTSLIEDCVIYGNEASGSGGGAGVAAQAILTIRHTRFTGNIVESGNPGSGGGALMIERGAVVTIEDSIFSGNEGRNSSDGGAMRIESGTVSIANCSILGNRSSEAGGGVHLRNAPASFTNCSFQGNLGSRGGAVFVSHGFPPNFTNCSFQGNRGQVLSGGVGCPNDSQLTFTNCILWNNALGTSTSDPASSVSGSFTFSHCLVQNLHPAGTGNLDGTLPGNDPLFVSEVDPLSAPHDSGGDLRLQPGSPAIDAGDDSASSEITDLAGNPRFADGDSDTTATIDLGAYEMPPTRIVTSDADSGTGSLREILALAVPGTHVTFDPSLDGATITLTTGQLDLTQDVTIDASPLPRGLTLSGNNSSRILAIHTGTTVNLEALTFTGGNSPLNAGAIVNLGETTIRRCTFTGNTAATNGGAISNATGGQLTIENSTFHGNSQTGPTQGGGAITQGGAATSLTLRHCTVTGNSATGPGGGGGIQIQGSNVTLVDSIVAGNTATGGTGPDLKGTLSATGGVNFIGDDSSGANGLGTPGTDYLTGDPMLGPFTGNGGPTFTRHPLPGSPVIDPAGGDASPSTDIDQRGARRLSGTTADIGAVESFVAHVDQLATGDDDGSNWADAFTGLQDALTGPRPLEVLIAEGTYLPGAAESDSFAIRTSLSIYGGFPSGGDLFDNRDPAAHPVILSGELQDDADPTNNAYHVVLITDGDAAFQDVLLDGLTITGGYADLGSGGNNQGGGIDNRENLTLRNVTVADNLATSHSGGIALRLGTSLIEDCVISGNEAGGSGGGGARVGNPARLTVRNTLFTGNIIDNGGGGALRIETSAVATIEESVFSGNRARNGAIGGAIETSTSSTASFTNCSILGNSSAGSAGGVSIISSSPNFTNCSFLGNRATAGAGGAVFTGDLSSPIFTNCSFQGNRATVGSGGIFKNDPIIPGNLRLTNCILWNNALGTSTSDPASSVDSYFSVTYSHCLVQNRNPAGTGNLDGTLPGNDPLFAAEVDPLTAPHASGGDLRLLSGSPALDIGNDSANSEATDLAGNPRKSGTIDLGAYEGSFVTFSHLYGGLSPDGDDNHNGHLNFTDYALGGDPTAPHDPALYPALNGGQLTLGYRENAIDVTPDFRKSTDLLSWDPMVEGLDYNIHSSASGGGRTLLTLDLLIGPPAGPRMFFREEFAPPAP
ncbi:right-handed parallel beta-helix repeat-containing protein [Luteolibacter marinus]|uniref:right-handed parallel beta-helix repeat-containing protein n=1 Tax=Luteolibacter marinus TaxID=2776705 RepID=UPI0018689C70|nr:right-handed parallel beta-helix repeat-containing protein [Luteolibacter marinus]